MKSKNKKEQGNATVFYAKKILQNWNGKDGGVILDETKTSLDALYAFEQGVLRNWRKTKKPHAHNWRFFVVFACGRKISGDLTNTAERRSLKLKG